MKKKSKKKGVRKPEEAKKKSLEESITEERPFDFGGLPDRNLKKNLGCG